MNSFPHQRQTLNDVRSATVVRLNHEICLPRIDKLVIPCRKGFMLLNPSEISYCKAEGNYTMVVQHNGEKTLVSKCLKHVLRSFGQANFIRVHQSYAVPAASIRFIGADQVTLNDNNEIPLSRRYRKRLLSMLNAET